MPNSIIPGKGVYHPKRFYSCKAYWELNGSAIRVLEIFYLKRQLHDKATIERAKISRDSVEMIRNNGNIIFTYDEAKGYGLSKGVFNRSIDKLIEVGFLDVAKIGGNRMPNKYALSDRWMKFGTPNYEVKIRPNKGQNMIGLKTRFQKNGAVDRIQSTPP
ncbi:hypothetical protein ACFL6P_01205 [Candidatus Latescibacterota bacterium]